MGRVLSKDGLSLAYQDEGAGDPPLLCLPGLTRSGADFDHFAAASPKALGAERRIVRLDSRGRGLSDHDPDFANYNVMVEAGDALTLLDHLEIERAVIIGSSRGGLLAMVIAATAPERLAGVVLNDVGPVIEPTGAAKIMDYLGVPPAAKTMDEAAAALEAAFGPRFPGVEPDFWREWAERSYKIDDGGLALSYDPALRDATLAQAAEFEDGGPDLWPLFDALLPIPTLALRAEHSDILSDETMAAMAARKPDLETVVIADCGHIPRLDEPDALAAIVTFLKSLK